MVEGEFKTRIKQLIPAYEDFLLEEGEEPRDTEHIFKILDEAEKEFPKKKERARVGGDNEEYNVEYYDADEMDAFKKRWFGQEVKR